MGYRGGGRTIQACLYHCSLSSESNRHNRLRGHRGPVTALRFIAPASSTSTSSSTSSGFLISTSRDTFMKLWDLTTQHCMQTIVAHQAEIWSMDVDPVGELIFTGSTDGELKAWSIASDALEEGVKTNESGEVRALVPRTRHTSDDTVSSSPKLSTPSEHSRLL